MYTYAIVLYFDKDASAVLGSATETVAAASGNRYMLDVDIPPHITIGSFQADGTSVLKEKISSFLQDFQKFCVEFDKIASFEPKVVFASPKRNACLEKYNRSIHELLKNLCPPGDNEYYTPEKWIPHCALALKLNDVEYTAARKAAETLPLPLRAKVEKIALARCNPYCETAVWEIG